jgi:hypothetical protein
MRYVHRLVASAFLRKPDGKVEVSHMDGNKRNNHISNLCWESHVNNLRRAVLSGNTKIAAQNRAAIMKAKRLNKGCDKTNGCKKQH